MNIELARDKPLFESDLNICVQGGVHADPKTNTQTFRIIEGMRQQQASSQAEKIFHFELTDPAEPFNLYILDIGELDFHQLKRDQSIIVDFLAFPAKLIALLKTCISHTTNAPTNSSFSTTLDANSGLFSVIESNEFKNLTHISLQLRPANDAALKSYLAARLRMAIDNGNHLRAQLFDAEVDNETALNNIADLNASLAEMRSKLEHEVVTLNAAHANEVSSMKVTYADNLNKLKLESEHALSVLREQSDVTVSDLRAELTSLQETHSATEKERSSAEYGRREVQRELDLVIAERDRADASAKQYSSALGDRDKMILQLEREIATLTSKLEANKQQLKDKEETIAHAVGEKEGAEASRREAIERSELYSTAVEAMQEKLVTANNEMQRGNHMIKAQLQEIDDLREKIRVKNEVIRKQEAFVVDLRAQVSDLASRLQNETDSKLTEQKRVELLTKEVEAGREKVAAGLETLERNKEVMNHLNEMISQLQMGGNGGMGSPSWVTPPAVGIEKAKNSGVNKSYGFRLVGGIS